MVLLHKIIQMQRLHRDEHPDEDGPSGSPINAAPATAQKTPNTSTVPHPERPRTRSQTLSLPAPRRAPDAALIIAPAARKRPRDTMDDSEKCAGADRRAAAQTSNQHNGAPKATHTSQTAAAPAMLPKRPPPKSRSALALATTTTDSAPASPATPTAAVSQQNSSPTVGAAQFTFLDVPASERRGPRARAAPPVPVPNLNKKSRGRRVPIAAGAEPNSFAAAAAAAAASVAADAAVGVPGGNRVYVCKVENCGKCFNRGEHLKRHIRSLHTYEKPFKCTYVGCEKHFNRHDNLLQHLKVHRSQTRNSTNATTTTTTSEPSQPLPSVYHTPVLPHPTLPYGSPPDPSHHPHPHHAYHQHHPHHTYHHPHHPHQHQHHPHHDTASLMGTLLPPVPRYAYRERSPPDTVGGVGGRAGVAAAVGTHLVGSYAAGVAVSSLRTEIPQSPVDPPQSQSGPGQPLSGAGERFQYAPCHPPLPNPPQSMMADVDFYPFRNSRLLEPTPAGAHAYQ